MSAIAPAQRSRLSIATDVARTMSVVGVRQVLVRELSPHDWHARGFAVDGHDVLHRQAGAGGFAAAMETLLACFGWDATSERAIADLDDELASLRVEQIFLRQLGPHDFWQASAFAVDANHKTVEAKAAAPTLRQALSQLLANLDQATDTEDQ